MNLIKKIAYNNIIPLIGLITLKKNIIPIIYYHNIVEDGYGYSFMHTEISVFKRHMEYLKTNGYKTYIFDEVPKGFKKDPKEKEVIITFDDGFLSNYTIAYPILKKMGLKFNVFLTTSYMDNNITNYLTWDMIKIMSESNIVGFGAHTYSHIDSRKINEKNYGKEICLTNDQIRKYTGKDVNDFCFPYGYYDKNIINRLIGHKTYKRLYTSDYLPIKTFNYSEIIGRIPISNEYDIKSFKKHLEGKHNIMYYYLVIRRILKRKKRGEYNENRNK